MYFDEVNKQYVTPLPFNGKEEFLRTNEASAKARSKSQQYLVVKDHNYMGGCMEAFGKMLENRAIETIRES